LFFIVLLQIDDNPDVHFIQLKLKNRNIFYQNYLVIEEIPFTIIQH